MSSGVTWRFICDVCNVQVEQGSEAAFAVVETDHGDMLQVNACSPCKKLCDERAATLEKAAKPRANGKKPIAVLEHKTKQAQIEEQPDAMTLIAQTQLAILKQLEIMNNGRTNDAAKPAAAKRAAVPKPEGRTRQSSSKGNVKKGSTAVNRKRG